MTYVYIKLKTLAITGHNSLRSTGVHFPSLLQKTHLDETDYLSPPQLAFGLFCMAPMIKFRESESLAIAAGFGVWKIGF